MKLPEAQRQQHRVIVGIRKSGSMVCVEGQHRLYAALLVGDPSIPASVFPSDGWRDEFAVYQAWQLFEAQSRPDKPMRLDAPEGAAA